jgi:cytoskeletal protein CcmA (bactofilin family)
MSVCAAHRFLYARQPAWQRQSPMLNLERTEAMSRQFVKFCKCVRLILLAIVTGTLAIFAPASAFAAEVRSGDTVLVPAGETISDDVYAFGNNVIIQGTVRGDVIAAASTVTIDGHVGGNVMAAGNTVMVNAPVDGTVRAAGNLLTISSPVAGDAVVAGSSVTVNTSGRIGRDVLAAGGSITFQGPIGRDVKAAAETLTLSSSVGGSVQAEVSDLVLGSGAAVQGPIAYVSGKDLSVAPDAQIGGSVQRTVPPTRTPNPWVIGGIDVLGIIRGFIGLAAFGLLFALLFPRATMSAVESVQRQWLASLGLGFGLLVGIPLLAALVFAIGLLIGGWWIGLIVFSAYFVLAVLGYLAFAEWVGVSVARLGNWPGHTVWSLLVGLAVMGLVTMIPFIGPFVAFIAVVLGLGAITFSVWRIYRGVTAESTPAITAPTPAPLPAAA